jgi:hypothetical protein
MLVILTATVATGEIQNLQCTLQAPTDSTLRYNSGQVVSIRGTWDTTPGIATSPFAATFRVNGTVMGSANVSAGSADFSIPASALPEQPNQFSVTVIETSVPNAVLSSDAAAGGTVTVDRTPPGVTLSIVSGAVVSPQTGFNEVVFQCQSSEGLGEAPTFVVSPGNLTATPIGPEVAPYIFNQYKVTVPTGSPGGGYTITATARDATEPAGTRNVGTGQVSFTVDAAADGTPAIQSSSPASPVRTEFITLSGTIPAESGAQKVEVLEGTTVVGTANIAANAGNWSVTLNSLTEGTHKYTARRIDPLGNTSPGGNEFSVTVDRTAPHVPALTPPKTPVNTTKISVTGTLATDEPHKSFPVKVTLLRDGTIIANTTANADGTFTFSDVTLTAGTNLLFAQAADTTWDSTGSTGNQTTYSTPVSVVLDQNGPVVLPGGIIISSPGSATPLREELPADTAPTGFTPPIGAGQSAPLRLEFPQRAIQDRFPEGVTVALVVQPADDPETFPLVLPMTPGSDCWQADVPASFPQGITYHFLLTDRAGNVSTFPESGRFSFRPRRVDILMLHSTEVPTDETCDHWPTNICGLPPLERLLSYRTILVGEEIRPHLEMLLETHGMRDVVEIRSSLTDGEGITPFAADINLLRQDRLPGQRLDLLLADIVSERIPLEHLPGLAEIPANPGYQAIQEAIQFRALHAPSRP